MIEFLGSDFEKNPPKGWVFEFFLEKSSVMLSFEGHTVNYDRIFPAEE